MPKKIDQSHAVESHNHGADSPFGRGTFEWRDEGMQRADQPVDWNLDNDPGPGGTYRGLPVLDQDGVIGQIDSGRAIDNSNGVITYTFADTPGLVGLYNNPNYGFGAGDGYKPFSPEQESEARMAIELWDDLIPQTFRETNGMGADIVFANSADPAQAYAYYPVTGRGWQFQSDVFVADPDINPTNAWFGSGGYGTTTIIHELGHSLGLSHPGAYNYDPALDLTYANYAEYAQDSEQYTIMSYWDAQQTGARIVNWDLLIYHNPQTPLIHDILTIQTKYGADTTTRADDTVYGFNSTADRAVYDFSQNDFPYLAIYDAGGEDTIDLSGYSTSQFLDLHAGSFSSIGGAVPTANEINQNAIDVFYDTLGEAGGVNVYFALTQGQVNATANSFMNANAIDIFIDTGVAGVTAINYSNVGIAYDVTIENGVGGQGRDVIWGNEVDNMLDGQGGDDVLVGFEGDDILLGGLGDDVLNGSEGNDSLTGGEGADAFEFSDLELGDVITDFNGGDGDTIDLGAFADALGADLSFIADADFSGAAGEVRYDDGMLSMDANGDGAADFAVAIANNADVDASMLMLAAG